ncbi:MAG: hypothetical protein K2O06_09660 [Acetatifactor sp.]|nr:hypothetical protein [Acetatifactor sp.]
MKKRFRPKVLTVLCILGAVLCLLAGAVFGKLIRPNVLLAQGYEMEGVDVSHYQGDIQWELLEEHYGARPVIYATYTVYRRYIEGEFDQYPLWIRNVYYSPNLDLGRKWDFWQYTDKALLEGGGTEPYVDCNVFSGTAEELAQYIL